MEVELVPRCMNTMQVEKTAGPAVMEVENEGAILGAPSTATGNNESVFATSPVPADNITVDDAISSESAVTDARTGDAQTTNSDDDRSNQSIDEEESDVPPDELAFVTPPHFSSRNPFHKNLSELDLSMRCPICCEMYNIPVSILPCLHSFCSECIRQCFKASMSGMKRKATCPTCKVAVETRTGSNDYERAILPNKHLDNQVRTYKNIRTDLRSSLVLLNKLERQHGATKSKKGDSSHEHGIAEKMATTPPGKKRTRSQKKKDSDEPAGKSRNRYRRNAASSPQLSNNEDDSEYTKHDDGSTTNKLFDNVQKPPQQKMQRKPIASYHNVRKKDLMEFCRKEGLSVQGNEEELKRRHSDFITLYNSECDSVNPRTAKELVNEIKRREKAKKEEATRSYRNGSRKVETLIGNMKKSRETVYTEATAGVAARPTSGDKAFDKLWDQGYQKLIEQHRQRKRGGKDGGGTKVSGTKKDELCSVENPHCAEDKAAGTVDSNITIIEKPCRKRGPSHSKDDFNTPKLSKDVRVAANRPLKSQKRARVKFKNTTESTSLAITKTKPASLNSTTPKSNMLLTSSKKRQTRTSASASGNMIEPWSCPICTFFNKKKIWADATCEMCYQGRPSLDAVKLNC